MSRERDILQWLTSEDTGTSSKTLAYRALGLRWRDESHPLDPSDFNRCMVLMEYLPWVGLHLPEMRAASPHWAALVDRWSELEALFLEEAGYNWSRARAAPKTYRLMKEILDPVPDPRVVLRMG